MTCEATVSDSLPLGRHSFHINMLSTKKKCPTLKLLLVILKDLGIPRDLKMWNIFFVVVVNFATGLDFFALFLLPCLKHKYIFSSNLNVYINLFV